MANWENHNGKGKDNDNGSSFFTSANICILTGAGFGLVCQRLWSHAGFYEAKAAALNSQLAAATTIPISSLNIHLPILDGHLVLIQNGVVSPLKDHLVSSSGREAVLIRTVVYTDEPAEFKHVYRGIYNVNVSRVPLALVDHEGSSNGVIVKAHDDHLPLEHESTEKTPLDPPVFLSRAARVVRNEDDKKRTYDNVMEVRKEIQVHKVTNQSVLRPGTLLESVFGRLKVSDGGAGSPSIEPCPGFPKECFTMGRSEIKMAVDAKAKADALQSFGVGLISFGLLFTAYL